jgi:hypothetical protein
MNMGMNRNAMSHQDPVPFAFFSLCLLPPYVSVFLDCIRPPPFDIPNVAAESLE